MRLNHVQIFRAKFIPGVSLSLEESVDTWVKLSLALKFVVEVCQNFFPDTISCTTNRDAFINDIVQLYSSCQFEKLYSMIH